MCLITRDKKVRIAEEDIVCYIRLYPLKGSYKSIRYITPYKEFRVSDEIIEGKEPLIAEGIKTHTRGVRGDRKIFSVDRGYIHLHTRFVEAKSIAKSWGDDVFKVIIPAGVKYYVSEDETEMCAERIVFKEKMNI